MPGTETLPTPLLAKLALLAGFVTTYNGAMSSDQRVQLNVRVRPEVRSALKALAALAGKPQSEVMEEMIEESLREALVEAAEEIKRHGRRVIP